MQAEAKVCFYLGANSPTGFYSLYDQLLEPEQAETIYILKGRAGLRQVSLMRRVAQAMEEKGASVEYIACSGDPDSLGRGGVPRPEHRHCGRHRSSWLSNRRIL